MYGLAVVQGISRHECGEGADFQAGFGLAVPFAQGNYIEIAVFVVTGFYHRTQLRPFAAEGFLAMDRQRQNTEITPVLQPGAAMARRRWRVLNVDDDHCDD